MPKFQNIYIIGFRASGKTSLAAAVSRSTGLTFQDTDQELQQRFKMSIQDIIARHGWDYFRDQEEKILVRTASYRNMVVATGGGIVLREANRNILKDARYLTIYLEAYPYLILERLKADPDPGQRPPLTPLSIEQEVSTTLAQRKVLYEECADLILAADQNPESLADRVTAMLNQDRVSSSI